MKAKWIAQLWRKHIEGMSHDGVGSEKRITKMWVVAVLLSLTIADWFYEGIRIDVWSLWFGLIGYDGYRTTREKQTAAQKPNQNDNNNPPPTP